MPERELGVVQGGVEMAVLDGAVLGAARCRLLRGCAERVESIWISNEILR